MSRYVASLVASGVKKRYPKASIKLTPGGCGSFFEIYVGKERKLVHSKKGGDGEPEYDGCEDFVEKLCKKFQDWLII